jgi:hypothetical protein
VPAASAAAEIYKRAKGSVFFLFYREKKGRGIGKSAILAGGIR